MATVMRVQNQRLQTDGSVPPRFRVGPSVAPEAIASGSIGITWDAPWIEYWVEWQAPYPPIRFSEDGEEWVFYLEGATEEEVVAALPVNVKWRRAE